MKRLKKQQHYAASCITNKHHVLSQFRQTCELVKTPSTLLPMGRHVSMFLTRCGSQKPHGQRRNKKTTIKAYYDMVTFIHSLGLGRRGGGKGDIAVVKMLARF